MKGDFRWPPYNLIPSAMESLEAGQLREFTPCRPASVDIVAERIARVHAELLFIHPFREGNGRLARWLANIMAIQAGYPMPEYNFSGAGKNKQKILYLNAVMRGYGQDYLLLTDFFREAIDSALRR